jgi:DNA-binding response OmpR family regulator
MIPLDDQIGPYGYHVVRIDPAGGSMTPSAFSDADMVIIHAERNGASMTRLVGHAATLPGRPGILVIECGLDAADRVLALELGADDCVTCPFVPRELVARIHAILRRRQAILVADGDDRSLPVASNVCSFSGWVLWREQRRLARGAEPAVALPAAEFEILDLLLSRAGSVVSRQLLLGATAQTSSHERRDPRAIDLQISRLRKRLEIDGREIIRTVRGRGYMIIGDVAGEQTA